MSGLGRRSHYRKHLTDNVLNEYPEPNVCEGDAIAQIQSSRGGNLFDLIVAPAAIDMGGDSSSSIVSRQSLKSQLAILPTKYHKLVWIKRGDYVIVESGAVTAPEEESEDNGLNKNGDDGNSGIRYLIKHILYKKQISHLKERQLWPTIFIDEDQQSINEKDQDQIIAKAKEIAKKQKEDEYNNKGKEVNDEEEDGYYSSDAENDDDDLFLVNTNHLATMKIHDSSSEDESD